MAIEIVDFPMKNGDFLVRYVNLPEGTLLLGAVSKTLILLILNIQNTSFEPRSTDLLGTPSGLFKNRAQCTR